MANLEALLQPKKGIQTQRIVAGQANTPWESRFYVRSNFRDSRPFEVEVEYALPRVTAPRVRTLARLFGGNSEFQAGLSKIDTADFHDETSFFEIDAKRRRLRAKVSKDVEGKEKTIAVKYLNQVLEALGVKERYSDGVFHAKNVPDLSPENIARAYSLMDSKYYRFISNGSNNKSFSVSESKADREHAVVHFAIKKPRGYVTPGEIRLLENTISYLGARLNNVPFLVEEHLVGEKRHTYNKRLK